MRALRLIRRASALLLALALPLTLVQGEMAGPCSDASMHEGAAHMAQMPHMPGAPRQDRPSHSPTVPASHCICALACCSALTVDHGVVVTVAVARAERSLPQAQLASRIPERGVALRLPPPVGPPALHVA